VTLENSVSQATVMNVFGSSQSGETNKIISNLEQTVKSYSNKLDKFEHLLDENHKSVQIQEEQVEAIQSTCVDITEHMTRSEISLQLIKENIEVFKNIIPAILSRLNTIETYYKDKS